MDGGEVQEVVTDASERFAIKADRPGVLLALTRYRVGPRDGQSGRSLTYPLTFDVGE